MKKKIFVTAGLLISVIIGGVAFAQNPAPNSATTPSAQSKAKKMNMSELRNQCMRDAMTYCRADLMSPDRIIVCLRRNRSVLSVGCGAAVDQTQGAIAPGLTPKAKSSGAPTLTAPPAPKTKMP